MEKRTETKMKIRFLGTGAAEGVPGVYCDCETCREVRRRGEKEYHTRSQLLIDDGILGIDYPPDAYTHALRFNVDMRKTQWLLITHSHMDHFYAYDFILRGYKYASTGLKPLYIYGNEEVRKVFEECTKREMREQVRDTMHVITLSPFESVSFDGYTITPLLAQHSTAEAAFVYLIEKGKVSYLHLTDTGRLPKATLDWLETYFSQRQEKVNFVTFDCTFLFREAGEISRHMGLEDNRAMEREFLKRGIVGGKTRYAITHFSHNGAPLSENLAKAEKEYGYLAAYDGLEVKI